MNTKNKGKIENVFLSDPNNQKYNDLKQYVEDFTRSVHSDNVYGKNFSYDYSRTIKTSYEDYDNTFIFKHKWTAISAAVVIVGYLVYIIF